MKETEKVFTENEYYEKQCFDYHFHLHYEIFKAFDVPALHNSHNAAA